FGVLRRTIPDSLEHDFTEFSEVLRSCSPDSELVHLGSSLINKMIKKSFGRNAASGAANHFTDQSEMTVVMKKKIV
ncbi:MAG: hypothetical protein AAF989_15500, partial [Planctomycetota bacterium]